MTAAAAANLTSRLGSDSLGSIPGRRVESPRLAMASNAVLNRKAEEAIETARLMSGLTGETEHVYDETLYAAGSWK